MTKFFKCKILGLLLVWLQVVVYASSTDSFVPVEDVYALIRVKNECKTLKQSLYSILPAIQKGVIVYNECTDGSGEIIQEFCKENKGFICMEYMYHVEPVHSLSYTRSDLKPENRIDTYYNFALNFIPKNKWFLKIDGDQIFDAERLKKSFKLVTSNNDIIVYPRIDLHYDESGVYVISNSFHDGIVRGGDQILILNTPEVHFEMKLFPPKISATGTFCAFEVLIKHGRTKKWAELLNYHFPFLKNYRKIDKDIKLTPIEDFVVPSVADVFVDPLFTNKERIKSTISKFE